MVLANQQSTVLGVVGEASVERAVRQGRGRVDHEVSVASVEPPLSEDGPSADCLVVALDDDRAGWVVETVERPAAPPVVAVPRDETDAEVVETALSAGVADVVPRSVADRTPSVVVERAVTAARGTTSDHARSTFDGVAEPLALHDPATGEVIDANRALCDLLGYGRSELVAMDVGEYTADIPGYDLERAVEVITTATETGSAGPLEWPLETADGDQVWVEVELRRTEIGGRERVLSTATDVTDRRRQRRQLREISEHIEEVVYLMQADLSEVLFVNDSYEDLFGQSAADLERDPMAVLDVVHPEDRADYRADLEAMAEHVRAGGSDPVEFTHRLRVDGETRWVRVTGYPSRVPGEAVDRIVGVVRDVTEARRREREYEQVFNEVDVTVTVHDPEERTMVDVNRTLAELTGYDRATLIEGGVELFTADDADVTAGDAYDIVETVAETGEDRTVDWPVETADGERRWLSARATTATIGGEKRVIGVSQDITERKRREREYEQIFNSVNDSIVVHDPETAEMVDANDTFCELLGYDRETILELGSAGVSVTEEGYTEERAASIVEEVSRRGEVGPFEWRVETADGERRTLEVTATQAEIGGQQRHVSLMRDITERRQREQEYKQIFNSVNDAIVVFDPETAEIVDVNDRYHELLGYEDFDRIRELGIEGLSVTEEGYTGERGRELIREVAATGETTTVEWRGQQKNGDTVWLEATLAPATIGGEQRVLSIQRDITARHQREREYEQIFNSVTDAIVVYDPETAEMVDVNDSFCELLGHDRETILEKGVAGVSVTDEGFTRERADEIIKRVAETGESENLEWELETADGERRTVESTVTAATVGGEQRVLTINRDVTERRRRQRQLEVILERIDEAIYLTGGESAEPLYLSPAFEDLTGLSLETLYEDPWAFVDHVHPDDRQKYQQMLDRIERDIESNDTDDRYDIEFRFQRPDGETRWFHGTDYPLEDSSRYSFISVLSDVTERRRREREFEQIFNSVTDIITVYDPETGELIDANETMADLLGYDRETILELGTGGVSATDLGYERSMVEDVITEVAETDEPIRGLEWALRTASGETLWAEVDATPARINGQHRVLAIARDVTERRDREERVQVLNRVLRHNLRNDMDAVRGYATAIAEGNDRSEVLAERIRETADALLRLSAKARDTEAVLRGDDERGVDGVGSVVDRTVEATRSEFNDADLSVACPAGEVPVEAEPLRLVLQELVENAAQHAGENPTVEVRVERAPAADHDITVTVADDGPGLPERALRPIRTGGETQFEHNRGLGLWLVHWGVRRLGGSVEFDRPDDGGTVARLRLNAVDR